MLYDANTSVVTRVKELVISHINNVTIEYHNEQILVLVMVNFACKDVRQCQL